MSITSAEPPASIKTGTSDWDDTAALVEAGLTEYQAKAYLALRRLQQARILQLARASGVPRNKLYHAMDALSAHGLVEVVHSRPVAYSVKPIGPYLDARVARLRALQARLASTTGKPAPGASTGYSTSFI